MDPVDWRPREWNVGADYLVNLARYTQTSGRNLTTDSIRQTIDSNAAIQVFSDGGYTGECGAYGMQVIAYPARTEDLQPHMVGYSFAYVRDAISAFQMEFLGLDTAVGLFAEAVLPDGSKRHTKYSSLDSKYDLFSCPPG